MYPEFHTDGVEKRFMHLMNCKVGTEVISSASASIIKGIWQYPNNLTDELAESLDKTDREELSQMMNSKPEVVETFLESPRVHHKFKHTLIKRLVPFMADLALDKRGSWIVEKSFNASDLGRKKLIAAKLAPLIHQLGESTHGRVLIVKLHLDKFKVRPALWEKAFVTGEAEQHLTFAEKLHQVPPKKIPTEANKEKAEQKGKETEQKGKEADQKGKEADQKGKVDQQRKLDQKVKEGIVPEDKQERKAGLKGKVTPGKQTEVVKQNGKAKEQKKKDKDQHESSSDESSSGESESSDESESSAESSDERPAERPAESSANRPAERPAGRPADSSDSSDSSVSSDSSISSDSSDESETSDESGEEGEGEKKVPKLLRGLQLPKVYKHKKDEIRAARRMKKHVAWQLATKELAEQFPDAPPVRVKFNKYVGAAGRLAKGKKDRLNMYNRSTPKNKLKYNKEWRQQMKEEGGRKPKHSRKRNKK